MTSVRSLLLCCLAACGGQPTATYSESAPTTGPGRMKEAEPQISATTGCAKLAESIAQLEPMLGEWEGDGWVEMRPGTKETFSQREVVGCEGEGEVLTIRGTGVSEGKPSHQAFGMVYRDPHSNQIRMHAFASGKGAHDVELKVESPAVYTWESEAGDVKLRFRLDFSAGDTWNETGEMSFKGSPFRPFMAMQLRKYEGPARNRRG